MPAMRCHLVLFAALLAFEFLFYPLLRHLLRVAVASLKAKAGGRDLASGDNDSVYCPPARRVLMSSLLAISNQLITNH